MRLREMLTILEDNEEKLHVQLNGTSSPDNQQWVEIQGLSQMRLAVRALGQLPGLSAQAKSLLSTQVLLTKEYTENPAAPQPAAQALANAIAPFREVVTALRKSLEAALPRQDPNSIVVQLPELELYSETVDCMEQLGGLLARVGAGTPVKVAIQNFDTGSLIVEIVGEIAIAMESASPGSASKAFAGMVLYVWGLAGLARRWRREDEEHDLRRQRLRDEHDEKMRARRAANDDLEDQVDLQQMLRSRIRDELERSGPLTPEQLTHLTEVTLKLASLGEQGMKLFAAAHADEDLKQLERASDLQLLKEVKMLFLPASTQTKDREPNS